MFPSWWTEESTLIVIDLGIDESKLAGSKQLIVSAVVGQTSLMRKLAARWELSLDRYGVDYFHAKDHWNGRARQYHGLSRTKRNELLALLIEHVQKFAGLGLSIGLNEDEYRESTTPKFRSTWGSPYSFAIQLMMPLLHLRLKEQGRLHEKVNILVESGHSNTGQALEILTKGIGRKDGFVHIASVGVGGKVSNPILQAADLLAYGACQHHTSGESQMYRRLVGRTDKFAHLDCDANVIREIVADISTNVAKLKEARVQERLNRRTRPPPDLGP